MSFPTLAEAQKDWSALDASDFKVPIDVHLISHEQFTSCPDIEVEYVTPSLLAKTGRILSQKLFCLFYAHQLLRKCSPNTVLILNGGDGLWLFVGILNRLSFFRKRNILCFGPFVDVNKDWKRAIMSFGIKGITLSAFWSRKQISAHANFFDIPEDQFIVIPFKANDSKSPSYDISIGNFVFAGGNSKRDYTCLIEAIRGTGIPVVISATDPNVRRQIEQLPNVIILGAPEPGFGQLQAASSFVVIPMTNEGLRGAGEANFCNAMWHGKAVIAADSISASDYILDGETGFVVPSGDSRMLRKRIMELWNDPDKMSRMGEAGRRHVEANFTHAAFIRRLLRVALLLGRNPHL